MRKEFVMRGKTAKGLTEELNFGKYKAGHAYRITELKLFPTTVGNQTSADSHICAVITAGKTPLDPQTPDFSIEGCIANALWKNDSNDSHASTQQSVIDDTFIITQNLLLTVFNVESHDVNWQCRFESVKMSGAEEAAVNYKQFAISDGS